MLLKLVATFLVSLFVSIGSYEPNKESRVLQPKNQGYHITYNDDNAITGGYYSLYMKDNALTQLYLSNDFTWSTTGLTIHEYYYYLFATKLYEGIADYTFVGYFTDTDELSYRMGTYFSSDWTGADFFIFDLYQVYTYSTNTFRLKSMNRYYVIGEQKLGTLCYFEDPYFYDLSFTPSVRYIYISNPLYPLLTTYEELSCIFVTNNDTDKFYTKDYTLTKPCLINSVFNNTSSSLNYEVYFYPFCSSVGINFTIENPIYPYSNSYEFYFGFEYPQNTTYTQGYNVGYDSGYRDGIDNGYNEGYTDGYDTGMNDYYDSRYQQGYQDGINYESQLANRYTFMSLFGAIADTPIMIMRNLLNFDVFGVSAMTIVMSMITGCIVLFLIRKFI